MFLYLKTLFNFTWLLLTDKCRFINILPRMPEMLDSRIGLLHQDKIFIDYDRIRYIKTDLVIGLLATASAENSNNVFKKLRDNSKVKKFMPQGSYNTTCGICISKMKRNDIVRNLKCNHSFHINCIDQWFEKKCCCPYCNEVF